MPGIDAVDLTRTFRSRSRHRCTERRLKPFVGSPSQANVVNCSGCYSARRCLQDHTIKMLITLRLPTCGRASALGYDALARQREGHCRVGYVFGNDRGLHDQLSGGCRDSFDTE